MSPLRNQCEKILNICKWSYHSISIKLHVTERKIPAETIYVHSELLTLTRLVGSKWQV